MLRVLRIENLAVVASAEIEFGAGLNLLTGETGAGKSIVVDALGLVCGERADGDLVRTGEEKGTIEAIFDIPKGFSFAKLGLGIEDGDGEIAIRREVLASGRSRAMINGVTVSLSGLKAVGQELVQIHGQHQHHALLDADFHLAFLDEYAGLRTQAERARKGFAEAQAADGALADFRERARQFGRERDALRFQVEEIRKAALRPGEEEELREERSRLRNAERLGELTAEAVALLEGTEDDSEGAILTRMRSLGKRFDELARLDPAAVKDAVSRHAEALSLLNDWSAELADYSSSLDAQPGRIDEVETRLSQLERLRKKYGSNIDEILIFLGDSRPDWPPSRIPRLRSDAFPLWPSRRGRPTPRRHAFFRRSVGRLPESSRRRWRGSWPTLRWANAGSRFASSRPTCRPARGRTAGWRRASSSCRRIPARNSSLCARSPRAESFREPSWPFSH
jgi:DNA repair protein RecN (Recombination protein N)